jgi:large subunit ribosomal protein L29
MAKAKDLREKTDDELKKELENLVEGQFKLRFRKVTDVVENPAEFKKTRREIARIKTILRERELKGTK